MDGFSCQAAYDKATRWANNEDEAEADELSSTDGSEAVAGSCSNESEAFLADSLDSIESA